MSWDSWEDAPVYELLNLIREEVSNTQSQASGFFNSVCKVSKKNGSNKVTVTLKKKDLEPFYKMRQIPFELGGILDISENGLVRSGMVGGSRKTVGSNQLPNYAVHFHTHPSFPAVPDNTGIIEYAVELYKRKPSKFPIDVMLQSVSNTDLSTFSSIVLQNRSQAMVIFSPEGVYVLTPDPSKLRTFDKERNGDIEELKKEGKRLLELRNEIITDCIEKIKEFLVNELGTKSNPITNVDDEKIISRLRTFQRKLANKIVGMINKEHSILHASFHTWSAKEIGIEIYCTRVLDEPNSFLGLAPHEDY